jgi:hypothetical protein
VASGQLLATGTAGSFIFNVSATDGAGNQTLVNHSYTVLGARDAINALIQQVQALGLQSGIENSLVKKLQNAQKDLDKGNTAKAVTVINDFINEVTAQRGKKIPAAAADALIAYARLILAAI